MRRLHRGHSRNSLPPCPDMEPGPGGRSACRALRSALDWAGGDLGRGTARALGMRPQFVLSLSLWAPALKAPVLFLELITCRPGAASGTRRGPGPWGESTEYMRVSSAPGQELGVLALNFPPVCPWVSPLPISGPFSQEEGRAG